MLKQGHQMQNPEPYLRLRAQHLRDARLFADRNDMLLALRPEQGLAVCEVGVATGIFSLFVLRDMRPSRFVAIDLFDLHTKRDLWGERPEAVFSGRTHLAHYQQLFAWAGPALQTMQGFSHECLATCADASFDVLYLDADHSYEAVTRDIAAGARTVKPDGLLVFNDYVLQDHLGYGKFGVVQAVNELVMASDWRVVGFALQRHMYCDIALRRV